LGTLGDSKEFLEHWGDFWNTGILEGIFGTLGDSKEFLEHWDDFWNTGRLEGIFGTLGRFLEH
jgi:hypothetical protein